MSVFLKRWVARPVECVVKETSTTATVNVFFCLFFYARLLFFLNKCESYWLFCHTQFKWEKHISVHLFY